MLHNLLKMTKYFYDVMTNDYFALTEQSIRIWSPPVDKSKNNKSKIEYAL